MLEYAKRELARIDKDNDGMQDRINNQILEIIEKFSKQGHSGFSASYALSILERLLRFKPITPLTGEDDEWNEVYEKNGLIHCQNRRCSSVFMDKDKHGNIIHCEDIDAYVVSDNGGITWFSSGRFRKTVTFPYTPPTHAEKIYIEYIGNECEVITDKPDRIKALYERKIKEFEVV